MKCFIRSGNKDISDCQRAQIVEQVERAFRKIKSRVKFVVVSFQSIGGFRGENDKHCKVKIVGEKTLDVYTFDTGRTQQEAFSSALKRAHGNFIQLMNKTIPEYQPNRVSNPFRDIQQLVNTA